jgi:hypothetical protein
VNYVIRKVLIKTFKSWYCAKHLKETIEFNKNMAPLVKNMFGAAIELSKETKKVA